MGAMLAFATATQMVPYKTVAALETVPRLVSNRNEGIGIARNSESEPIDTVKLLIVL